MSDVIAIRHVAFEDLGILERLLAERGLRVRYVDAPLGSLQEIDPAQPKLLVVLGGPISAYEEKLYPFLTDELNLIERRLQLDRPMLGICLGAQLMARALGQRVYPSGVKEIGWGPISLTVDGKSSCLRHLGDHGGVVLHWHGDTFDLPTGAVHLAATTICPNQAFSWGQAALALQFHAEVLERRLEQWFVGHAVEIQTANIDLLELRRATRRWSRTLVQQGGRCFAEWLDLVLVPSV